MNGFQDHDDLIYDVGMNHGADAAFYCAQGFRVLSIEAKPASVTTVRQRHTAFFESGQLQVMNVALAEEPGKLQFHVCNEESGKSRGRSKAARGDPDTTSGITGPDEAQAQPFH
ncbi:FkbM family methyltransferase [Aquicoccus sp.]|uniref:FkbM family methyltransferase n=1 Tax=Aquicoccus sp. TaxID=2055851 RepID=UPI0035635546